MTLADISVLRTSSPFDHRCPLDWLPTSRLLPPRSGLERSDLVHWHFSDVTDLADDVRSWRQSGLIMRVVRTTRGAPGDWSA